MARAISNVTRRWWRPVVATRAADREHKRGGGDDEEANDGVGEQDPRGGDAGGDCGRAAGAVAEAEEAASRVLQRRVVRMPLNVRTFTVARRVELESVVRGMAAAGRSPGVILVQEAHVTAVQLNRRRLAGYQQFVVLVFNGRASMARGGSSYSLDRTSRRTLPLASGGSWWWSSLMRFHRFASRTCIGLRTWTRRQRPEGGLLCYGQGVFGECGRRRRRARRGW